MRIEDSRGAVNIHGFKVVGSENPDYVAFKITHENPDGESNGAHLGLQDGTVELLNKNGLAISSTPTGLVMKNVYVKADKLLAVDGVVVAELTANEWNHVPAYGYSKHGSYASVNGEEKKCNAYGGDFKIAAPDGDLIARHVWGKEMPAWDLKNHVNVVAEYGAKPSFGVSRRFVCTGEADDVPIQQAIDDVANPDHPNYGKTVFIPNGDYRITKTLQVHAGVKLIGAGKTSSVLKQDFDAWEDPARPLLETADTPDSGIILSDLYILACPQGRFYNIRSGNIIMRDLQTHVVQTIPGFEKAQYPYATFSNHASGKVYNLCSDHVMAFDCITKNMRPEKGYALLAIENKVSEEPLNFYQASIEHLKADPAQAYIRNSKNIHFNGMKHESGGLGDPLMDITDSEGITFFSTSGHYALAAREVPGIFNIHNSRNIEIISMNRQAKEGEPENGCWVINGDEKVSDDSEYYMWYLHQ
jgi:hypothetical protein